MVEFLFMTKGLFKFCLEIRFSPFTICVSVLTADFISILAADCQNASILTLLLVGFLEYVNPRPVGLLPDPARRRGGRFGPPCYLRNY